MIERLALGWGAGGTQGQGPTGKIEVSEDGTNGNGIGDEGEDAHGSTAGGAKERQHLVDTRSRRASLPPVGGPLPLGSAAS